MTITADHIDMTRLALEVAVDQLTQPNTGEPGPDGKRAKLPSLLAQLEGALTSNSGRSGSSVAVSKPPVWIDGLDLLREIDREIAPYRRHDPRRTIRLRAWSAAMHSITDRDALEVIARQAEEWVRRARSLLNPVSIADLDGHCPTCGRSSVESADDEGERVRRPALRAVEADEVTGLPLAWCDACAGRWEGESLWLLADHLQRQTEVEHLGATSGS